MNRANVFVSCFVNFSGHLFRFLHQKSTPCVGAKVALRQCDIKSQRRPGQTLISSCFVPAYSIFKNEVAVRPASFESVHNRFLAPTLTSRFFSPSFLPFQRLFCIHYTNVALPTFPLLYNQYENGANINKYTHLQHTHIFIHILCI